MISEVFVLGIGCSWSRTLEPVQNPSGIEQAVTQDEHNCIHDWKFQRPRPGIAKRREPGNDQGDDRQVIRIDIASFQNAQQAKDGDQQQG